MYRSLFLLTALLLVSTFLADGQSAAARQPEGHGPDRYIVTLREGADPLGVAARAGAVPDHAYHYAIKGFAARLTDGQIARLQADPSVVAIEEDQLVTTTAQTIPTGVSRIFAPGNTEIDIDGSDDYRVDVDVAVIDTGIDLDHPDLNVVASVNCAKGGPFSANCGSGGDDDNGHGTHVAGTIGALDNNAGVVGVAPGARLWAVKVLGSNGSGYMSWIIAGIDHVTANAAFIEVANMSLGCECPSTALNTAIATSVDAGVVYVVAAGNSARDSAAFSPANHPDVITVSALADFNGAPGGGAAPTCRTDQDDTLADFSNFGPSVEIAAPGVCILSTWRGGGYSTISGTSMASPHVAGAAALLASMNNPGNDSAVLAIRSTLVNSGNYHWTDESGDGIKEPLLDVSNAVIFNPVLLSTGGTTPPPPNTPPTASFTYSCTDLACQFTSTSTDTDGSIASHAWTFGDGNGSTSTNPFHTYATGDSYTVGLTVTDNSGATAFTSQVVTVTGGDTTPPPPAGITLTATGYKVKGNQHADLTWSGAAGTNVDIHRDGVLITTTANDGAHTDNINRKGGGSYDYKVCEAGTSTCSNTVTVSF